MAYFSLTAEDVLADNYGVLLAACYRGRFEIAQWFIEQFGLTAQDILVDDCEALVKACFRGKSNVVQWFIYQFDITREDLSGYKALLEYEAKLTFSEGGLGPKFAAMGV